MSDTTARLRKTFHYKPDSDDDDDNSLPEALDEEEQASLIQTLQVSNTHNNKLYARALLALPVLSATIYLRSLLFPASLSSPSGQSSNTTTTTTYYSILSLTSLALSAYALWILLDSLPTTTTTDRRLSGDEELEDQTHPNLSLPPWRSQPNNNSPYGGKGPLETYLPYLNTALVTLLALAGLLTRGRVQQGSGGEEGLWLALLPGFVYGIVLVARWIMGSVDVGELEGLRYGYKGA